jgi:predicted dienelactone hydrolase
MGEMANPKVMELLQKFSSAGNDEERLQVFADMETVLSMGLSEGPKYWAEDISFFIDQLNGLNNEDKFFKNKLNLNRLGVFGMSLGGLASIEACLLDHRIKACVSMDGGLNGSIIKSKIKIPAMFLNSKKYLGYGNIFTNRSEVDCYSFTVKNSDHYNFSDYSIYPVQAVKFLLGSIDGKKTIEIMDVVVLAFFDKYLKQKQEIDLTEQAKKFSEIEIATNTELIY